MKRHTASLDVRGKLAFFSFLLIASFNIQAIDVRTYEATKDDGQDLAKIYLTGAGEALSLANIILIQRGAKPIYCPPQKLALHGDNYLQIFEKELDQMEKSAKFDKGTSVEIVLMLGLQTTFPCR